MKKNLKITLVTIGIFIFVCMIIFWGIFSIILIRRPTYKFKYKEDCKADHIYYEKDNVNYYAKCLSDIDVIADRFFYKDNLGSLKDYIKDDKFDSILSKMSVYKYNCGNVIETKYSSDATDIVIIKCSYENNYNYIISKGYNICSCN